MEEHGVPVRRIVNGGGIPQRNPVLNQVYANVMGKPVLVPGADVTSLGSAIFAFLAAGTFQTVEEAQDALCPKYRVVEPDARQAAVYSRLYELYRKLYFGMGTRAAAPAAIGDVLPELRDIAEDVRRGTSAETAP
jgi:L-ribulokinase